MIKYFCDACGKPFNASDPQVIVLKMLFFKGPANGQETVLCNIDCLKMWASTLGVDLKVV